MDKVRTTQKIRSLGIGESIKISKEEYKPSYLRVFVSSLKLDGLGSFSVSTNVEDDFTTITRIA